MDWAGWALFGLVATAALTAVSIAAQLAGQTRLDVPLLLGTLVTEDPDRARVAGFFIHMVIGEGFALGYAATFALLDRLTWWLGGLLGLLHAAVALTVLVPLLPGVHPRIASDRAVTGVHCLARTSRAPSDSTTDRETPIVTIAAHLVYGSRARRAPRGALDMCQRQERLIEDYGLLGDTRTAALVGSDGAIDWMCIPRFDGPPVFGRLVGGRRGTFAMGPACPSRSSTARYHEGTATLETTWECADGRLTLTEAMIAEVTGTLLPATLLVRRLTASGGSIEALIDFAPRLGEHHPRRVSSTAATSRFAAGRALLSLSNAARRTGSNPDR